MSADLMCHNCALQRRSTIIAHGINVTRNSSRRCNPLPPPPASTFDDATFSGDTNANNNTDTIQHQFSVRMANNTWRSEFSSPPAGGILLSSPSSSVSSVPSSTPTSTTGTRTSISVQIVNGGNSGSGGIGSGGPCSITTSQKRQQVEDHLLHEEHDTRNRPYAAGHGVFKSLSIFPAPEPTPCQHHLRHRREEGEEEEEVLTNLQTRKIRKEHSKLTNTMSAPSKLCSNKVEGPDSSPASRGVAMERLRRSFRDSFRKKKEGGLEASKPHQWQHDEAAVRAATCAFPVKYLGCVEVFESRGMQVCEEALKVLRASRRRPIRGMLHVSGDGLRVVDDETKGLLVDQTIEKVSFCAPDRNHERGFSYICRDGTTRRWMCHGFVAIKETGERLSHAVGCAFAACLDRKQKRDKECGVTMTFDQANNTFTRMGSFKQMSITDRLTDPQVCKPNGNNEVTSPTSKAPNPHAIARPHATPLMLQRQGSCRVFHHLNQSSPFKRQLSLRLNDLPSNMERQRSHSLTSSNIFDNIPDNTDSENGSPGNGGGVDNPGGMTFPSDAYNNNGAAYGTGQAGPFPRSKTTTSIIMSSIPEDTGDSVSALCQELWQGLSLLSSDSPSDSLGSYAHPATASLAGTASPFKEAHRPVSPKIGGTILVPSVEPIREELPWSTPSPTSGSQAPVAVTIAGGGVSKAEEWLAQLNAGTTSPVNGTTSPNGGMGQRRNPPLSQLRANTMGAANPLLLQQNQPPAWKPTVPAASYSSATPLQHPMPGVGGGGSIPSRVGGRQSTNFSTTLPSLAAQGVVAGVRRDPFDAEWVSLDNGDDGRPPQQQPPPTLPVLPMVNPNNPFLPASAVTKAFEVQM